MEFLRVGEEELQIKLTSFDLNELGLCFEAFDYSDTRTRKVLWQLLDAARQETGFDAAASRICVHLYASKNGGCELFVRYAQDSTHSQMNAVSYRFEDLDALLECRGALRGFCSESTLYEKDGVFFLLLSEDRPGLCEFGTPCCGRYFSTYLKEHARLKIEKTAVQTLFGKEL